MTGPVRAALDAFRAAGSDWARLPFFADGAAEAVAARVLLGQLGLGLGPQAEDVVQGIAAAARKVEEEMRAQRALSWARRYLPWAALGLIIGLVLVKAVEIAIKLWLNYGQPGAAQVKA